MTTAAFLATHPVFSLEEAANTLRPKGDPSGTVRRLKHYLSTGRLVRVARELYAVPPPGVAPSAHRPDAFLVALASRPEAIFAYHSALELNGAAQSVWSRCTVHVDHRRPRLVLNGAAVEFLAHPEPMRSPERRMLGVVKVARSGRMLATTGPERTLVEGFRRPDRVGGIEELIVSAAGFAVLDLELLEEVLRCYEERRLFAAVGWFLEHFRETFYVPEPLLGRLQARRPAAPQYLLRNRRGGLLHPRWNLIVPQELGAVGEPDEP